jgi:hypothetical protein
MSHRFAAAISLGVCALALTACGSSQLGASERLATEKVASVPPCPESQESGCENGQPLCMLDEGDACRICRCTEYMPMASSGPGPRDPNAQAVYGPAPYNGYVPR